MSLTNALLAKLAAGVVVAGVVGGGTTVAVQQNDKQAQSRHAVSADAGGTNVESGDEVVIDPVTGARTVIKDGRSAKASALQAAKDARGRSVSAEAHGDNVSATAKATPSGPGKGAQVSGTAKNNGDNAPGTGPGSGVPGFSPSVPAVPNIGVPVPAAPTTPTAPSGPDPSAYRQGSYSVIVPATGGVNKELCLSGTTAPDTNQCRAVTVPATEAVTLTVAYSGNGSAQAPTFTPTQCGGGIMLTVAGLTPGATVSVTARDNVMTATVPANDASQSGSLCDK